MGHVLYLKVLQFVFTMRNFSGFSIVVVSNTNTIHALRTGCNNKHPIFIETKMKQFGVLGSLGKTNGQIKHFDSLT